MKEIGYRAWLEAQVKRGGGPYKRAAVDQYIRDNKGVEKVYGNLDELYAKDRLAEVLRELECSAKARKGTSPSPNGLYGPGYKTAVTKYCEYRRSTLESPARSVP